jgi:adenylate cyclase
MRQRRALFTFANRRRARQLFLALVAVACTGVALAAYSTQLLAQLEGLTIDARFSIRGNERPPSDIVVVGVDAMTFDQLDIEWPFPRSLQAKLINRIDAERPAVIAFDVQFSEKSSYSDEVPFVNAISNTNGRIVFSTTETLPNGDSSFLGEDADTLIHEGLSMRIGNGNQVNDPGGTIRRMVHKIDGLDTFAVATAEVAMHRKVPQSSFQGGTAYVDYLGPRGTFHYLSYVTGLRGKLPKNYFRGKIVVIGAVAPTLGDIHATSTDTLMPGPEVQANEIETVLRGLPLRGAPGWLNIALVVLLGATVPLISVRLGPLSATAIAFAIGGAYAVIAQLAFNGGLVLSYVYPTLALVLSGTGSLAVQLVTEAIERIRTRDLFSRFVPQNVVDEVLASADGLRLGGVQREGTVMFSDLRGFTSLAESLTPAQVIDTLNHYLSEMSDTILDHGGTLVAYMGDGIMAVFGAPLPQTDHADRALSAAREMLHVRLPRFNQWLRENAISNGFRMGIGLNSGHVMSGHVGSERRVEYTAVGDTTNSASRIEGMTKGTPYQLLVSDATRQALSSPPDDLVFFAEVEIRGRVGQMKLWGLPDIEVNVAPDNVQASPPAR